MRSREVVEQALRWNIGTGTWRPGEVIPNERELASRLGVGRSTLRSAIDVLRVDGLLVTTTGRGGGTRVAERTAAGTHPPVAAEDIVHHFELRCAVEPETAALAAERGTTTHFDCLRDLLRQSATGVRSYAALTSRFHIGIAEASGNPLMRRLVAELCVEFAAMADILRPEPDRDFGSAHRAIYDSLMTRDAARAHTEVRTHLADTRDTCLALVDGWVVD